LAACAAWRTVDAGDPETSKVNGSIDIAAGQHAGDVSTVNGAIHIGENAVVGRVSTVNGGITLTLPADLHTDVKATTVNGDITTDFPLTITGRVSRHRIEGTIGGGGRLLSLETVNGSITLKSTR